MGPEPKFKKGGWKIFFCLLLAFNLYDFTQRKDFNYDWYYVGVLMSALYLIAVFGYSWEKRFFSRKFWKVFFWTDIFWTLLVAFFFAPSMSEFPDKQSLYIFQGVVILFSFPFLLPLYRYAYEKGHPFPPQT